jgi:hypothetical protein
MEGNFTIFRFIAQPKPPLILALIFLNTPPQYFSIFKTKKRITPY